MHAIDFVVTYLDDCDPGWRSERSLHSSESPGSELNTDARYRSLETFRYWLRAVEKNAPWVRKIHIVTWGHVPDWLNKNHPKISVVRHDEFIPKRYLPTFSSRAIEMNLDRIPGLSEHFVSFNDDFFLTEATRPEDFFRRGLPVLLTRYFPIVASEVYSAVHFWNALALNKLTGGQRRVISRRALSPRNGLGAFASNLLMAPTLLRHGYHIGFIQDHLTQPLTKTTMSTMRSQLRDEFEFASRNRFRHVQSVNIWLVSDYMRAMGRFYPRNSRFGKHVRLGSTTDYESALHSGQKIVCLNDGTPDIDFDLEKSRVLTALEAFLPNVSEFELVSS